MKKNDKMHVITLVIKMTGAIKTWEALNETITHGYVTEEHLCKYRT